MNIQAIDAFTIYDSRGNPTIEAEVVLSNGIRGCGLVPSGASTGQFEAHELRDADPSYMRGKSVKRAISHVSQWIAPALLGMRVDEQEAIDRIMIDLDGTKDKSRLGANAILAVSLACADAAAKARGIPLHEQLGPGTLLPLPEIQLIGGGAHAAWRTDIQDFLLIATGAKTYEETLEMTFHVYHAAAVLLAERGLLRGVADEGGYWPEFPDNEAVLAFCVEAIRAAGYQPGTEIALSVDVAASDLYDPATDRYWLKLENRSFSSAEWTDLIGRWCDDYPIVSIEDPLADVDSAGWDRFAADWRERIQIIGDDLFTTNIERIRQGIDQGWANAVLIKLNQIGTVTETLAAIDITRQAGWRPVISARSGETEDAFISHLAVGTSAGQLKVGSFSRGERMAKWNEVLRIARRLGQTATFDGPRGILPCF
jgi:enolase